MERDFSTSLLKHLILFHFEHQMHAHTFCPPPCKSGYQALLVLTHYWKLPFKWFAQSIIHNSGKNTKMNAIIITMGIQLK